MQEQGTAITEMREHAEPRVDGAAKLIERRVAVARGGADVLLREHRDDLEARVALWGERDHARQPLRSIEQTLHQINAAGANRVHRMRAGVPFIRQDKRALDVKAGDELFG